MKNFDLNAFGVKEMEKCKLIEVNGGQLQPGPSVWWSVGAALIQIAYVLIIEAEKALCERASQNGYVMYADVSHR